MVNQAVPIIRREDLPALGPMVFGFSLEWGPYVAEVEARCQRIAQEGDNPLLVVIAAERYLAWCAVNGAGPNSPVTLSWYAQYQLDEGECYELISGVDILLRTAELDLLADRISVANFGLHAAPVVLDAAQTIGEQLVRTAGEALPADGWIRVSHPGAPDPAGEWFDAVSQGIVDQQSFPADVFELICSHATVTCLIGGSLAAEHFHGDELGYVIWRITPEAVEGLRSTEAADFVAEHPFAIPEGAERSESLDAPKGLEPL